MEFFAVILLITLMFRSFEALLSPCMYSVSFYPLSLQTYILGVLGWEKSCIPGLILTQVSRG